MFLFPAQPTVSGLHDFDYPNMMEAGMGPDSLAEFVSSKRTPLPPLVVQEFGRILCLILFIELAWFHDCLGISRNNDQIICKS